MIWKILHKLGFHKWELHHCTGINEYYECKICKKRYVKFSNYNLYQPVDFNWLNNI